MTKSQRYGVMKSKLNEVRKKLLLFMQLYKEAKEDLRELKEQFHTNSDKTIHHVTNGTVIINCNQCGIPINKNLSARKIEDGILKAYHFGCLAREEQSQILEEMQYDNVQKNKNLYKEWVKFLNGK